MQQLQFVRVMTLTNTIAAKLIVAFVAISMVFFAVAPVQAQTADELQATIDSLMAQIAALNSQVGVVDGNLSSAAAICPYTWTRSLNMGATGADVMKLQQYLNATADTQVAAAGSAGSPGMETSYYGPATGAAVAKFQTKYRTDILSPLGLVNPTTYFGPSTMTHINKLCVNVPTTPTDGDDDDDMDEDEDEDEDDDDNGGPLRGEASLDTAELDDGETTIEEGDEDEVIGEFTVEFQDGDAEISRIDIALDGTGNAEPWDAFDTISLWVDGDKVAEMDASDEDDYLDEDTGEIRFTGLDIIAREDDELEILIAASVQNNLDADELTDWTLTIESMRFFDADDVATTESDPTSGDTAEFDIQAAGTDEELDISLSSSNPDSTDIVVDTDTDTDDVTILVADLEAGDNDIELDRVVVKIEVTSATSSNITSIIDEARLVIDGKSFKAEAVGTEDDYDAAADDDTPSTATGISEGYSERASATTTVWYLFDIDGDVVIDEDEEVEMEVVVDFNDTNDGARYNTGSTIKASITSTETAEWEAEGAEDLSASQFDGTAVGDTHTLVAEGILVPADGFSSETDSLGTNDDTGEFVLTFEVTAVEDDFYITDNSTSTSNTPADGVGFTVTGGTAATLTSSLTSSADEDTTGVFTVREGETETFTLVVTVTTGTAASFRVQIDEIWYSASSNGTTAAEAYEPTPVSDFRTAPQSIQA